MANPFAGIITPAFKALFRNAIDALLEDTALTVPCRLFLGTTNNTQCANCNLDTMAGISANTYRNGGPAPFVNGSICPMCGGIGYIASEATNDVHMAVIWNENRSKFIPTGVHIEVGDAYVQTICAISVFPLIQQAKEVIFNTDIIGYQNVRFQRVGDPTPVGFGDSAYIITLWSKGRTL